MGTLKTKNVGSAWDYLAPDFLPALVREKPGAWIWLNSTFFF